MLVMLTFCPRGLNMIVPAHFSYASATFADVDVAVVVLIFRLTVLEGARPCAVL